MPLERLKRYFENDRFAARVGVELVEARPGYAVAKMGVDEKVLNAHGVAQGGAVFTLADFAFGAASMSRGRVVLTVDMTISYLRATPPGRTLYARAEEIKCGRNLCNYRVTVENDAGETVSVFQGTGFRLKDAVPGFENDGV